MTDRHFAVWIDGVDWTEEIFRITAGTSLTVKRIPGTNPPQMTAGRRTEYLKLTLRDNDNTRALVGSIPPDGHAEVLAVFVLPSPVDRISQTVVRMDATTLDASDVGPEMDTAVNIDGVDCFESAWYATNATYANVDLPHPQ